MDRRLLVLALGTFAIGTDNYVIAGILPDVAHSLGVGVAAAGQLVTAYALAYAVLTPIMAAATAHWPRRRVLLGGLALFVAGNVLTETQSVFVLVLASRVIAGLGAAIFTPAASATAAGLVVPERRGFALAVVLAGLSAATALGAPIGTLVGSVADWRMALWAVGLLGMLAGAGVFRELPKLAASAPLGLRDRLAPLADARVAVTLLTTVLVLFGPFLLYTYISVVFDRATGGSGAILAVLMSIWGLGATVGSLRAGALTDRLGNRVVINVAVAVCALDFALMPWTSASFTGAGVALAVWGVCGWGFYMAQQHRLVGIAPALAPLVLALNASVLYFAISVSSAAGALALSVWDPHKLPWLGASLIVVGLAVAETAHRLITKGRPRVSAPLRPQPVRR